MTATAAKSAAPAYAVLVWADERNVYAQLLRRMPPMWPRFPEAKEALAPSCTT